MTLFSFKANRGFTLIELMVSSAVGLFVMTVVISLMTASQTNTRASKALSKIQYNAQLAIDHLSLALQQAHFEGCKASSNFIVLQGFGATSGLAVATEVADGATATFPIEDLDQGGVKGYKVSSGGSFSPTPPTQLNTILSGLAFAPAEDSEVLVVYHTSDTFVDLTTSMNGDPTVDLQVTDNSLDLKANEYAFVGDCQKGDVFRVVNTPAASAPTTIQHPGLVNAYTTQAKVRKAAVDIYYVADTGRTRPQNKPIHALYRWRNGELTELVEGVLSMELNFGYQDPTTQLVQYLEVDDASIMLPEVTLVRVGLLIAGVTGEMKEKDTRDYTLLNKTLLGSSSLLQDYNTNLKRVYVIDASLRNQG